MKCPNCSADLTAARRDGLDVEACPSCGGMWLSREELGQLEDEAFDLGKKGSLVFHAEASARQCPECSRPLQAFRYRDYDLQLEFCADGHGYWLDGGEDRRVLELMRKEERALARKYAAEDLWSSSLKRWRSPGFIDKILNLLK